MPRGYRTPPEAIAAWVADYEAGLRADEIADKHGVCVRTVRRVLDQSGVPKRPPAYHRPTPEEAADWVRRYPAGETLAELARSSGWDPKAIRNALARAGVPLRPTGRRKGSGIAHAWYFEALKLRTAGLTYSDIAARMGSSLEAARMAVMRARRAMEEAASL